MTKNSLLLGLVILLAAFLRFNNLENNPPGFYTDEASIGFNAYKIYTSARDEHGKFLPVFFKAFGEYKNPFAIYPVVPFIAIFGLTEASVRYAQAAFGVLNVILIFFLAKVLWNSAVGLLSAFVLAISPWHVHLSRFIIESHNAFLLFIISGSLFSILAKRNKWRSKYLILAVISFGLSFYTYFAARIFTPLFLLGLLFFWRKDIALLFKKYTNRALLSLFLFILILVPFFLHMASGEGLVRFKSVSLSKKGDNLFAASSSLYAQHFEPKFVFLFGDSDYPGQLYIRHSITGIGLFYKWQLLFFVLGLIFLISTDKKRSDAQVMVLLMLILYPLGTVVSDATTPLATRSVIGILPYSLLIALGIYKLFKVLRNTHLQIALGSLVVFLSLFYLNRFIGLSRAYLNRAYGYNGFQYGTREIVEYFMNAGDSYSVKILDGGFDGRQAYLDFYSQGKCVECYAGDPQPGNHQLSKLIAVSVGNLASFYDQYDGEVIHKIYYPDMREAIYLFNATSKN